MGNSNLGPFKFLRTVMKTSAVAVSLVAPVSKATTLNYREKYKSFKAIPNNKFQTGLNGKHFENNKIKLDPLN